MYTIIPIIQNKFQTSSMYLILTQMELDNVKYYLRHQEITCNYHVGNTNHNSITEFALLFPASFIGLE